MGTDLLKIMGGITGGLIASLKSEAFDSDAQAFFTATGISDTTIKNAVNQLVLDYKSYGIWNKCHAIYPLVGGDATKHSYNLKNTAQYQIIWNGTLTHNSNGVTGDGSSGYGNTTIIPSSVMSLNSSHLSYYCRTNSSVSCREMGCGDGVNLTLTFVTNTTFAIVLSSSGFLTATSANTSGSFISSRTSSTNIDGYRNGSNLITSSSTNSVVLTPTFPIWVLGSNQSGSLANPSNKNYAMFSIGTGLSSTEVANKYTADQAFQTALSRQV